MTAPPYDKGVRPGKAEKKELVINIGLNVYNFEDFDEKELKWSWNGYVQLHWEDTRLKLPAGRRRLVHEGCPGTECPVWCGYDFGSGNTHGEVLIKNLVKATRVC